MGAFYKPQSAMKWRAFVELCSRCVSWFIELDLLATGTFSTTTMIEKSERCLHGAESNSVFAWMQTVFACRTLLICFCLFRV